jgi:hypothetical protein
MQNTLLFLMFHSVSFAPNIVIRGTSIFTLTILLDGYELRLDFHCFECVERKRATLKRSLLQKHWHQTAIEQIRENKDTKIFQSVLGWRHLPQPNCNTPMSVNNY